MQKFRDGRGPRFPATLVSLGLYTELSQAKRYTDLMRCESHDAKPLEHTGATQGAAPHPAPNGGFGRDWDESSKYRGGWAVTELRNILSGHGPRDGTHTAEEFLRAMSAMKLGVEVMSAKARLGISYQTHISRTNHSSQPQNGQLRLLRAAQNFETGSVNCSMATRSCS